MKVSTVVFTLAFTCGALASAPVGAQPAPANPTAPPPGVPADSWPRVLDLDKAQVLVYQPQIDRWTDNQLVFRAAMALKNDGSKDESFGVANGSARTQVDKVARTVVLENLTLSKIDFPTLPGRGASFAPQIQAEFAKSIRSISLDRLEASLAAAGIQAAPVQVQNTPPALVVSNSPAILVPIDGAPVIKPVQGESRFSRVVNTRALILQGGFERKFYLHVFDGWMSADRIEGPWSVARRTPVGMDAVADKLAKAGAVDMLSGGANANPKPSLSNGMPPAIYTSQRPTELLVFKGQPDFVPIVGTPLLWASNTTSDVLVDTTSNDYYLLLSGRWFKTRGFDQPLTFVPGDALPAGFKQIPPHSLAGAVLPTIAGTPQAQEAVIANSIPQTATVPLKGGPTFTPSFDGAPQYVAIPGTPLQQVINSAVPVIVVSPSQYYAVSAGVWFAAPMLTGPWSVATSIPPVIYTIPPSSSLHYVTYVRIYESTPQYVYVGYTPGYLGTVVSPYGTVVYGTGYTYTSWVGTVYYPAPYTYTVAAVPVYNPYVGYTFGFAMGLATAAWVEPYWGGAYYYPAYWGPYPCCATASANVYSHWGNTTYSGTRTWYGGGGVAGTTTSGTYTNARTGTSGSFEGGRQYNAWTGNATRAYDRTFNTTAGGSGQVARGSNYNVYTGQRTTANAASATGAGGSTYDRAGATTAGPQGNAHIGGGQTYNAKTGQTNTWGTASYGNNHYADINGNVYSNTGDGWQQKSGDGSTTRTSNPPSSVSSESQARASGEARNGNLGQSWSSAGSNLSGQTWDRGGGSGGNLSGQTWDRGNASGFNRDGGFSGFDRGGGGGWGGQHGLGESGGGWGGRFGGGHFGGGGFGGGRRR